VQDFIAWLKSPVTETARPNRPDRNGSDRNGPDRNGLNRIGQTEKSRTHNKNPESWHYDYTNKNMNALIWIETIIEYWLNYSSSSKFHFAGQTLTFGRPFCCSRLADAHVFVYCVRCICLWQMYMVYYCRYIRYIIMADVYGILLV